MLKTGFEARLLTTATIYHPRMISVPADPYGELAQWVLDRQGVPYVAEWRDRGSYEGAARNYGGGKSVPLLDTGETTLTDARSILNYYEERAPQNLKLYPADDTARSEARNLFDFLYDQFGVAVQTWTIDSSSIATQIPLIESALDQTGKRLADGRRFLLGDVLTAPDLALAALATPIILPPKRDGRMPSLDHLPAPMRSAIEGWRASPVGQFVLRLHANRPAPAPDLVALGKHGSGTTFKDKLLNFLIRPAILRPLFGFLRRHFPILVLGKTAIVTRFDDVIEILNRDTDFTIRQINEKKIDQIDGPFILGMDASPQYTIENATLHEAVRRQDLDRIRQLVAQSANELIAAARPRRRIDVVNGFARITAVRVVASYFGMPGPNDPTMMRWMRDVFHYIFADLTSGKDVQKDALHSVAELRQHMNEQIAFRKSAPPNDDVLGRLLALQDAAHPWLDDHAVRRNLSGVIVGAVDTTSKFVSLAIDELLRRPQTLAAAQAAALNSDIDAVRRYAWEAVRFNPHHPLLVRHCSLATPIAVGQARSKTIPATSHVYIATLSAMFDPDVFTDPGDFNAQRQTKYLHFGHGMHTCFGSAINGIQIPELLAALLRLPNLHRAPGNAGQIVYDGPFPNRLILEFDA